MSCGSEHKCQNCGSGYEPAYKNSQQMFCSSFCRKWWRAYLNGSRPDYNEYRKNAMSGNLEQFKKDFKEKRKAELKKARASDET